MDQLAATSAAVSNTRVSLQTVCLHRSVILVLHFLMAAPYRACIRSAHGRGAAQERSPGRKPGVRVDAELSPGGAKDTAHLSPLRGWASPDKLPRACARGYVLKPLRGGNSR